MDLLWSCVVAFGVLYCLMWWTLVALWWDNEGVL